MTVSQSDVTNTTSAFTIYEPGDQEIDEFYNFRFLKSKLPDGSFHSVEFHYPSHDVPELHRNPRSPDPEALELRKGSSGVKGLVRNKRITEVHLTIISSHLAINLRLQLSSRPIYNHRAAKNFRSAILC